MATSQPKAAPSEATANTPPASQAVTVCQPPKSNDFSATTPTTPTTNPTPPSSAPDPPKQRRRVGRRRVGRITSPEPGSIYDIMHDHQGESLYTHPLCWTDAHARLLNVDFIHCGRIKKPVFDFQLLAPKNSPRPSKLALELSADLTAILCTQSGQHVVRCITQLMCTFFPASLSKPSSNVDLDLHFGDGAVQKAVRVAVLWTYPEAAPSASFDNATANPASFFGALPESPKQVSNWSPVDSLPQPDTPILAFINRTQNASARRNLYRVTPGPLNGDRQNMPVLRLQQARSKKLIPADKDRDSYLVAIMVAIAQSQCYSQRVSSKTSSQRPYRTLISKVDMSSPPVFKDVPVKLLTQDTKTASFIVYSTIVTADFLKRFAHPMKAPSAEALHDGGLKVEYTKVSIWPVLGLKERLAQALGSDIVGEGLLQAMNDDIETWESELERSLRTGNLKRSRDVFSEVVNTGFDVEDSDTEAADSPPVSPRPPKRRRTEEDGMEDGDSRRSSSFPIPSPGRGASLSTTAASPPVSPRPSKRRRTEEGGMKDGDFRRNPSFSIPSPGRGADLSTTATSPPVSPRPSKRRRTEAKKELEVC